MQINVAHIVAAIKTKFDVEGLAGHFFEIRTYHYAGAGELPALTPTNCILIEFAQPFEEFPDLYKSTAYRLLILFNLYEENDFSPSLQTAIERLQYRDNIDRVVLWSTLKLEPDTLQNLKKITTDVISIDIPTEQELAKTKSVHYFIPIGNDLTYSLAINLIAEKLIKRLRKMFHLVLSEVSAPIYNQYYAKSKVATREAMEFEEDKLNELIKRLKKAGNHDVAIDVGCGTGRHSFVLSRHFRDVYAYDFSANMIRVANATKREKDIRNIFFSVNDFEYEKFVYEDQFYGACDLVVASFGMGSFIEDTASMLRRFYEWLKPGGFVFISFYNASAITLKVTPSWRDSSLAAQIDKDNNSLEVNLTPKTRFNIFCKLFDEGVEGEINKIFDIETLTTYPMLMALLPNSMLDDEANCVPFIAADRVLAHHKDGKNGYYAIVIAKKPQVTLTSSTNIERILQEHQATYEVIEHRPVLSIEDVIEAIGYFPNCMIKTIIFNNRKTEEFIAILLPAEKRVDKARIARMLGVSSYQIKFATEKEVLQLGFPVGGIAPFGFESEQRLLKFMDSAIVDYTCEWFYTGMGNNRRTLKIRKQDFLRVVADYQHIEL